MEPFASNLFLPQPSLPAELTDQQQKRVDLVHRATKVLAAAQAKQESLKKRLTNLELRMAVLLDELQRIQAESDPD